MCNTETMILKTDVIILICCLAFVINVVIAAHDEVVVSLPNGTVKGILSNSSVTNSSTTYYSFFGLRYAQPPTGEARFLAPVELESWDNVYDATSVKNICVQVHQNWTINIQNDKGSEDCLFLNVFTPKLPGGNSSDLLPVLFYIHGGGFVVGTGQYTSPDFFMDYDVVFVSINYRLGPFGFFSTGDGVIPGNAGLKDQNMALKWVNKNIQYFGGDQDRVTIFGQSAGSVSVSYHILSSRSTGLFRAAILDSGSALSPWTYQRDQKNFTYATASLINSTYNVTGLSSQELRDYLVLADAEAIYNASAQIAESTDNLQIHQGFHYAPVIEAEGDDAFLTKSMYELYENGEYNNVPVMIGINSEECLYLNVINSDWFSWIQEAFDANIKLVAPHDMHLSEENQTVVGQLITDEYLGTGNNWTNNLLGSVQFFTDHSFARSVIKQAELQSNFSNVYFYMFTYHGEMGLNNMTLEGSGNVSHGEELPYIFPTSSALDGSTTNYTGNLTAFPEEDLQVHYRLLSFWTNFVKYLNPTPTTDELVDVLWPKVNLNGADFQYLDIGKNLSVKVNPKSEKYQFWQNLYNEYAGLPYDTY